MEQDAQKNGVSEPDPSPLENSYSDEISADVTEFVQENSLELPVITSASKVVDEEEMNDWLDDHATHDVLPSEMFANEGGNLDSVDKRFNTEILSVTDSSEASLNKHKLEKSSSGSVESFALKEPVKASTPNASKEELLNPQENEDSPKPVQNTDQLRDSPSNTEQHDPIKALVRKEEAKAKLRKMRRSSLIKAKRNTLKACKKAKAEEDAEADASFYAYKKRFQQQRRELEEHRLQQAAIAAARAEGQMYLYDSFPSVPQVVPNRIKAIRVADKIRAQADAEAEYSFDVESNDWEYYDEEEEDQEEQSYYQEQAATDISNAEDSYCAFKKTYREKKKMQDDARQWIEDNASTGLLPSEMIAAEAKALAVAEANAAADASYYAFKERIRQQMRDEKKSEVVPTAPPQEEEVEEEVDEEEQGAAKTAAVSDADASYYAFKERMRQQMRDENEHLAVKGQSALKSGVDNLPATSELSSDSLQNLSRKISEVEEAVNNTSAIQDKEIESLTQLLQNSYDDLVKEKEGLKADLLEKTVENANLHNSYNMLNKEKELLEKSAAENLKKIDVLEHNMRVLDMQYNEEMERVAELSEEAGCLRTEKNNAEENLEECQEALEALNSEFSKLEAEVTECAKFKEYYKKKKGFADLSFIEEEENLEDLYTTLSQSQARVSELEHKLQHQCEVCEKLQAIIAEENSAKETWEKDVKISRRHVSDVAVDVGLDSLDLESNHSKTLDDLNVKLVSVKDQVKNMKQLIGYSKAVLGDIVVEQNENPSANCMESVKLLHNHIDEAENNRFKNKNSIMQQ